MSPQSIVVSDLLWVLVKTGGRQILLRSLAAKMAGLQRDTEDGGPVAHKERWSQGSLESEQGIPQIDLGVGTLVWGVSVGCLVEAAMLISLSRNVPHLRKAYWANILTGSKRDANKPGRGCSSPLRGSG